MESQGERQKKRERERDTDRENMRTTCLFIILNGNRTQEENQK